MALSARPALEPPHFRPLHLEEGRGRDSSGPRKKAAGGLGAVDGTGELRPACAPSSCRTGPFTPSRRRAGRRAAAPSFPRAGGSPPGPALRSVSGGGGASASLPGRAFVSAGDPDADRRRGRRARGGGCGPARAASPAPPPARPSASPVSVSSAARAEAVPPRRSLGDEAARRHVGSSPCWAAENVTKWKFPFPVS